MAAELKARAINVGTNPDGCAKIVVTITVQGANDVAGPTLARAGKCIADLGRAIDRAYRKYDITTRSPKV